ncbi:MAG: DUF1538 domain-containing protein [Ruminococcaceae bacterium]|nr:DUF1538 domain-containing protein [Oscillospiraceae bacterium]
MKLKEALVAVMPVVAILLILSFTVAPIPTGVVMSFLVGAALVMIGMMFFTLGAEMAMTPMGEKVGAKMTQSRNLILIVFLAFVLGVIVTISEPDLQVLAHLVPSIPNSTIILAVAIGVGVFLVVAILRMLLNISLAPLLIVLYIIAFSLVFFVPQEFRAIAFDSGGVTTGPMTVPFIMALGIGVCAIRDDKNAADDSFGLVALCSIGPILAVLILGMVYMPDSGQVDVAAAHNAADSVELRKMFSGELPTYMLEIAMSLLPIIVFFGLFQIFALRLRGRSLKKIIIGLVYTYIGLTLFMTGANVGFMPAGSYLGNVLGGSYKFILIPIGALIGFFIVKAEPAVYVLNQQVEEITDGGISANAMGMSLSVGVAVSVALAMIRVLTGIPILCFLIPGYAIALGLSFFTPKIFTAIAFDSGGVASGPMTATFLLPLAQGACSALGGDMVSDAFGVVAMVAMTPLITIQILGLVHRIKQRKGTPADIALAQFEEDDIIEL